jgi:hypothetical protein
MEPGRLSTRRLTMTKAEAIAGHLDRLNGLLAECEPLVNQHVGSPKPATAKQIRVLYQKIEAEVRQGKRLF